LKEEKTKYCTYLEFDNPKIYGRFWTMQNLCRISLVFSATFFCFYVVFIVISFFVNQFRLERISFIPFLFFESSLAAFLICKKYLQTPNGLKSTDKDCMNDSYRSYITLLDFNAKNNKVDLTFPVKRVMLGFFSCELGLLPVCLIFIAMYIIFSENVQSILLFVANSTDKTLPIAITIVWFIVIISSRVLIWISAALLYSNCKLMQVEWEENPPSYVKEAVARKEELLRKNEFEKSRKNMVGLLEQCGMKFFIKYYRNLISLPLRDIEIEENYSHAEKNERLSAAKEIIERNYTKSALEYILENYSDTLAEKEVNAAVIILQKYSSLK